MVNVLKKTSCIILVLALLMASLMQGFIVNAVVGVDDLLIISGIVLTCASMGVTIMNVSNFMQSDTWDAMCQEIGDSVTHQFELAKTMGKACLLVGQGAWYDIKNWVKEHFSGKDGIVSKDFDLEGTPGQITLTNGAQLPYHSFMTNPFILLQRANGNYFGYYLQRGSDTSECGVYIGSHLLQFYTQGTGKLNLVEYKNNAWTLGTLTNMSYGVPFKGQTGSVYSVNFSQDYEITTAKIKYRTIDAVFTNGNIDAQWGEKNNINQVTKVTQDFDVNKDKLIGTVDGVTENLAQGEKVIIEAPAGLTTVDGETVTIVNNVTEVTRVLENVTTETVKTYVDTGVVADAGVIDDVIADTPVEEIEGTETDIETANKFRLPKSFLEGFPFSIPYSVFLGIKSFVAEPQTPKFKIPFRLPRLGLSYDLDLDLSDFNGVASVCRALLSFVWLAGLALVCSKFLKR